MSILYYFIDEETRKLRPEAAHKVVAQKDHNADVIRVGIPETMDSVDLETSAVRCMYQRPKETEVRSKTATYYDTSGGYLWYDWTLQEGDTAKAGKINFSVCLQHIEDNLLTVDWNSTIGEIHVKTSYHSDDGDEGDETITPTVAQRVAVLETMIQRVASGAPIVVSSMSAMTDTNQIYVLSTDGNWYYHNGTAWTAGGEYGAVATDTTLTQSGIPADAKAVGDAIKNNKGLSDTAAALLISILGNALYASDQSDTIQALEEALIEGDIVHVTGVTLSDNTKAVDYGGTALISATVAPANATNRAVIWTTSNDNVATVSNGTITGVGVGNATITAETVDGGFTASCTVSVTVENLLKTEDATTGAYIDRDTGNPMASDSWTATDYIWLNPNTTYHSEGCFLENFYSFYDENKNHVSSPPSGITIEFGPDRNWGAKRKGTIAMGSQGYYFRGSYNTAIQYTPYIALTPIE